MEHQFASKTALQNKLTTALDMDTEVDDKGPSATPPALQFKSFDGKDEEEEESIQKKAIQRMETDGDAALQKKELPAATTPGGKMPVATQKQMEHSLGADFSQVKIHQNSQQAEIVNAQAFTQGTDVHFAPGKYDPSSNSGKELLGHELAHVTQQKEGRVQANTSVAGMPVNDHLGLEQEADLLGAKASQATLTPEEEQH